MAQTLTQLTIAWLIATIEAKRAGLAGSLARTPVADWGAAPVRDVRNHEQDLHTAAQVLGDMLNVRGAFADSGVPAVPHLEQARPIWLGLDLSADGLAELKKSLTDWRRNGGRMRIECMPAPALEVFAAVAGPALDVRAIAAAVCKRVAELPDRNSPEDWPEAMLVTGQELMDVVTCEIEQAMAAAAPALEAPAAPNLRQTRDKAGILHYLTPEQMAKEIVRLDARLAAAPQAPAAPSGDERAAYVGFLSGTFPQTYSKEEAEHFWDFGHVSALTWKAARAAPTAPAAPTLGDAERLAAARLDKSLADYWRNRVAGLAEEFTTAEAALYLADRIVADLYDLPLAGVARPAAPAAPEVDASFEDRMSDWAQADSVDAARWRAVEGEMDGGRVSLTVHHTDAEQWDGRTINDEGELQDYADSLVAQAKEGGDQ